MFTLGVACIAVVATRDAILGGGDELSPVVERANVENAHHVVAMNARRGSSLSEEASRGDLGLHEIRSP